MLARGFQEITKLIEVLSGSRSVSVLPLEKLLNRRRVLFQQECVWDALPSCVYLPVGLGRLPPTSTTSILDITNGAREFGHCSSLAVTKATVDERIEVCAVNQDAMPDAEGAQFLRPAELTHGPNSTGTIRGSLLDS
jgi:hypothetical protein